MCNYDIHGNNKNVKHLEITLERSHMTQMRNIYPSKETISQVHGWDNTASVLNP